MISHFPSEKTQKAFWPNWKRVPSGMRLKQPKFYFYQLMDFIIHMFKFIYHHKGLPRWHGVKEPACQCRKLKRLSFDSWIRMFPHSRKWQPTPVFLHGKVHGQRSLASYSPWGLKELNKTEHTHYLSHTIPDTNLKKQPIWYTIKSFSAHSVISMYQYRTIHKDGVLKMEF